MKVIEWDDIVQAFPAYGSNQPFAMSVGGWHVNGRFQYADAPALHRVIQTGRKGIVPIMKEKLTILITRKRFPQLLQRPFGGWVFGHVEVNETSGSDLERDKYIKDTEACRDGNEEIASYDVARVIPEKR